MSVSTSDIGTRLARGETSLPNALEAGLQERGWIRRDCPACGRLTFTKRQGPRLPCCLGYADCPRPPAPRTPPTARDVWVRVQRFFADRGMSLDPPLPVLNPYRDTIFTVAGMQLFQPTLRDGHPPPSGIRVVAQPCVRLRYADDVPHPDGISTSFVNLCTEEFDASVATHLRHLDLWIDLCSSLGLHASFIVLSFAETSRPHGGAAVELRWGGIELGEGIWNYALHNGPYPGAAFTDFGFGLDRLVWAATRRGSYYENVGPTGSYPPALVRTLDQLRTAALLVGSGVEPGPRDAPFQLRKLLRSFARETPYFDFRAALRDFLLDWKRFVRLTVGFSDCIRIIDDELRRHRRVDGWDALPDARQVCS